MRITADVVAASPVLIDDEPLRAAPRLLVFDEGTGQGRAVSLLLQAEEFAVEHAATPEELMEMTKSRRPAAILLAMSDVTRSEALCRELRSTSADAFIVVISPMVGEIVLGSLEAGADDFVTPSAMSSELLTRIRAGLRRSRGSRQPDRHGSQTGTLEILLDEHRVQVGNCTFELTMTEFRLLAQLASAPGRVFTRDVLLAAVWGYEYIGNGRLVDSHIWRLRRKLGGIAGDRIATVRGFGYKFVPEAPLAVSARNGRAERAQR